MDDSTKTRRNRDPHTGQYAYDGDFDRMCVCGHTLGVHVDGGFDCINGDVGDDRVRCECMKFRQSRAKRAA